MAGFSLPPQGADPRKHVFFILLLPPHFLVIKGICFSACAGISALMPAAASAARGVPRQSCSSSPSSHCPSFHNMTTKDRQSFVSSDSSVFTQLHWHGPLVKLVYLSCWHTEAQAGSLLHKSERNHLLGHMPFTPSHRQTVCMFIPSRLKWSAAPIYKNQPSFVCGRVMCQIRVPPLGPRSSDKWAEFWFSALLREMQLPSLPFLQPKSEIFSPQAAG